MEKKIILLSPGLKPPYRQLQPRPTRLIQLGQKEVHTWSAKLRGFPFPVITLKGHIKLYKIAFDGMDSAHGMSRVSSGQVE